MGALEVKAALLRALVAALVALLAMAQTRVARAQLLSPGPLVQAHASLEGDQHCSDCHSSGKRVNEAACLKCHNDLAARISAGRGLHGLHYKGKSCESCHVEHLGKGLVRWPGGDPGKLDHAQTGWPLEGAHKNVACARCHAKPNVRGHATYVGAPTACAACHKDVHQGRLGEACASCHVVGSWKELNLKSFNHDAARFPLRGAHQTVACAKCHPSPPVYSVPKFGACTDCHKDPHAGKLDPTCTSCHEDTRWTPVTFKQRGAKHPGVGLWAGHANVRCAACHDKGTLVAPSRGRECVACHKPVHKAPFGRGCVACHGTIQWVGIPASVGVSAHARTDFPLTGKHQSVRCASCHKPAMPGEQRYRKLRFGRCVDCHADQHNGEFAKDDQGECRPCHTTAGFRPTVYGAVAHAASRFPLTGKHTAAACSACHTAPRPRLDLRLSKQACADCHSNPHGDQFTKEMAQGGCAHCHQANGWKLPKIDHASWWPLKGTHATLQCEACHHPTPEDRKAGRGSSYRGVPRVCGACHDDAHLGQFRLSPPVFECDRCHTAASFKIPSFDHKALTAFALTGQHAKLECAKCHRVAQLKDESEAVRWRMPSHECRYCHSNPHESRASAKPTDPSAAAPAKRSFTDAVSCSACHTTTAWRAKGGTGGDVKFDHASTGFPLSGLHARAPCVSCHNATRALKRACVSCHDDFHRGRLNRSCDTCHSALGWKATRPLEIHRRTRFPLTGMHALADCSECHRRASEQRWTGAPLDCFACHEKEIRRAELRPVHVGTATSPPLPRDCSLCHRALAWVPATPIGPLAGAASSPLRVAPPGHDLRFPISFGLHRTASCDNCHASLAVPRAVRCVGCHAHDPVRLFEQHKKPMATDGASCLACHPGGARR